MVNQLTKKQIYISFLILAIILLVGFLGLFYGDSSERIRSIEWNENEILSESGEVLLKADKVPSSMHVSDKSEFGVAGPFEDVSLSPDKEWIAFTINGAAHGAGWLYEIKSEEIYPAAFQYGGGVKIIEWSPDSQYIAFNIGTPAPSEYIKVVDRNNISDFATETGTQLRLEGEAGLTPPFSYEFIEWQQPHTICYSLNDQQNCFDMSSVDNNQDEINLSKEVIVENLNIPWGLTFLPNGDLLVTERPGRLLRIDPEGESQEIENLEVQHVGEGGLLGVTLHPNFEENRLLYLYRTLRAEAGDNYINRIDQYKLEDNLLVKGTSTDFRFYDQIPGAPYHDGGRLAFGPDNKLYATVGDATRSAWSQVYNSNDSLKNHAGAILRLNEDGSIPKDNPFGNAVWSYGHRNPQGLTWDEEGSLWSTEHGRSGFRSGLDEINLIKSGQNYGWPDSQGDTVKTGTVGPVKHSGPSTTWAPASAVWWDGSLFFGGLRGEALYEAVLENQEVVEVKEHFKEEFGRIRTVVLGPDGMFYITTSNRDGRGSVNEGDDKIIRINPEQFRK